MICTTTKNRLKGYLPKGATMESVESATYTVPHEIKVKDGYRLIYRYKGEVYRAYVGNPGSRASKE